MTAVAETTRLAWPGGPVLIAPAGQERRAWLATRRRGIGGSDVAGILGLSRYASPLSTYMDKRGEITDDEASEAAEWGNLLEPVIADKWARDKHVHYWKPGLVAHPDRPWQLANLDGAWVKQGSVDAPHIASCRYSGLPRPLDSPVHDCCCPPLQLVPQGGLEVKTSNQYLSQDWDPDSDRMPDPARLQVQHYMDTTGLPEFEVAALIGGQSLRIFRETYDQELAEMVRAEMARFWNDHVLAGNPPPVDGSKVTSDLLGRLWEVEPEDVAVLDPADIRSLLERRIHAKAVIDGAEADLDLVENQIKVLLGPKQVGVVDGQPVVTWKQQTRKSYVAKESTFRVLRIPKGALDVL